MTTAPPTILIDGTVIQNKVQGVQRKNAPKRTRQRRRVALPALVADAVRRRLALAEKGPEALLFPTKTGKPMSVSNYDACRCSAGRARGPRWIKNAHS